MSPWSQLPAVCPASESPRRHRHLIAGSACCIRFGGPDDTDADHALTQPDSERKKARLTLQGQAITACTRLTEFVPAGHILHRPRYRRTNTDC